MGEGITVDVNVVLALAEAYAGQATEIFNMFLTVLFASFGFAAAMPLRDIGRRRKWFNFEFSSSSTLMGAALLAFYLISFKEFWSALTKANDLLLEMSVLLDNAGYSETVVGIVKPSVTAEQGVAWPLMGMGVGALAGLVIFMWLTNVARPNKG